MQALGAEDVTQAVAEMQRVLRPLVDRDWQVPAGPLEWTCWTAAAHVAHDLLAYAGQLTGLPTTGYLPYDLRIDSAASPAAVLDVVTACGGLLSSAITTAPADARAWHWGPADPSGFATLGVDEVLVHTWDITQGLKMPWEPPAALCKAVLARLFPHAPTGDPGHVLLWATGRIELDSHPRRTSWVIKTPLA